MPVTHAHQTAIPNDAEHDVSADRWNAAHTLDIEQADIEDAHAGIDHSDEIETVHAAIDHSSLLGPLVLTGSTDPIGSGVEATAPSLYIRVNTGVTELYIKTGVGDTEWTPVLVSD